MYFRKNYPKSAAIAAGKLPATTAKKTRGKVEIVTCHDVTGIGVDHSHILRSLAIGTNNN